MIRMFLGSYATNIFNVLLSCSESVWNKCNIPKSTFVCQSTITLMDHQEFNVWPIIYLCCHNLINTMAVYEKKKKKKPSYCFCISKKHIMQVSFHYQFFWPIRKTWLMSILILAMQLQHSHNQSQGNVHVDTCCPPKLQLLCPNLNVLWIISCVCKVLYVFFL